MDIAFENGIWVLNINMIQSMEPDRLSRVRSKNLPDSQQPTAVAN